MVHRQRFQYVVRSKETDRLVLTVFTDLRACKLPLHGDTHIDMVVGKHVIRIERSEAARLLRNARTDDSTYLYRLVDTYDSSDFCSKHCTTK